MALGPAKTLLVRNGRGDLALKIAEYESKLMLERGMLGSLPELLDAMKRPESDEIATSGTTSQAWSLAESCAQHIRIFWGIRPVIYGRDEPFWLFLRGYRRSGELLLLECGAAEFQLKFLCDSSQIQQLLIWSPSRHLGTAACEVL